MWSTSLAFLQPVGSSWTRDRTSIPCTNRWIPTHCTTRETLDLDFGLIWLRLGAWLHCSVSADFHVAALWSSWNTHCLYPLFMRQISACPSEQCLSLLLWAGWEQGVGGGEGAELQSQLWGQAQGVHLGSHALYSSLAPKTSFYLLHHTHTHTHTRA